MTARPICLRLLTHCALRAASRAACTAGRSNAIKTAMIAITTRSSISVNPVRGVTFISLTLQPRADVLHALPRRAVGERFDDRIEDDENQRGWGHSPADAR